VRRVCVLTVCRVMNRSGMLIEFLDLTRDASRWRARALVALPADDALHLLLRRTEALAAAVARVALGDETRDRSMRDACRAELSVLVATLLLQLRALVLDAGTNANAVRCMCVRVIIIMCASMCVQQRSMFASCPHLAQMHLPEDYRMQVGSVVMIARLCIRSLAQACLKLVDAQQRLIDV
jgi:hypothetical protein